MESITEPLRITLEPSGRRLYVAARAGERTVWFVELELPDGGASFVGTLQWETAGLVAIGARGGVALLSRADGGVVAKHAIDGYFGYFALAPDGRHLYVIGCSNVTKLDLHGEVVWKSEPVAVDGIVFVGLDDRRLVVSCELDPPGDWHDVVLDVATGKVDPVSTISADL